VSPTTPTTPAEPPCACPEVYAGNHATGSHVWTDSCPRHGLASDWYRDVGRARFAARADELRRLQLAAREARRRARAGGDDGAPGTGGPVR
jgi:hypothetical protein